MPDDEPQDERISHARALGDMSDRNVPSFARMAEAMMAPDLEIAAMAAVVEALRPLDRKRQRRMLCAVCVIFGFDDLTLHILKDAIDPA